MEVIKLEELEIYQLALDIGEEVWCIVNKWDSFAKNATGRQFVDAADSIAANIAEGYGRYFYKDRKLFCYYSRGSLMETKAWAIKSLNRKLISETQHNELLAKLQVLHHKLNIYIKKLKTQFPTSPIS